MLFNGVFLDHQKQKQGGEFITENQQEFLWLIDWKIWCILISYLIVNFFLIVIGIGWKKGYVMIYLQLILKEYIIFKPLFVNYEPGMGGNGEFPDPDKFKIFNDDNNDIFKKLIKGITGTLGAICLIALGATVGYFLWQYLASNYDPSRVDQYNYAQLTFEQLYQNREVRHNLVEIQKVFFDLIFYLGEVNRWHDFFDTILQNDVNNFNLSSFPKEARQEITSGALQHERNFAELKRLLQQLTSLLDTLFNQYQNGNSTVQLIIRVEFQRLLQRSPLQLVQFLSTVNSSIKEFDSKMTLYNALFGSKT